MSKLPSVCKDHPKAEIRHSYDQTQMVSNGYPVESNHTYECAVCGKRLCSPDEYSARDKRGGHFSD